MARGRFCSRADNCRVAGHRYLSSQLVRRGRRRKYKGSSLGILWYLINPPVLIGAYTLFGHVFKLQHFADFPIFLMVGLIAADDVARAAGGGLTEPGGAGTDDEVNGPAGGPWGRG